MKGGPVGAWEGCQVRAEAVGGQGQRRLPYFFMRATLTEERQNEWPVRTNEKEEFLCFTESGPIKHQGAVLVEAGSKTESATSWIANSFEI